MLTGMVAMIIIRTLRKDIVRYNKMDLVKYYINKYIYFLNK